jgi:serine/threonine protein kinase
MSAASGMEEAKSAIERLVPVGSAHPAKSEKTLDEMIIDFSNFQEIRELGRGGFGVVRLVEHKTSKQLLAVKYFQPGPKFDSARLLRETEVLCLLDHPCILRIVGWSLPGADCQQARIATEYVANGTLEDAIEGSRNGRTPGFWTHENVVNIIIGIILGMRYIHSKDVIHRDLKPSNIFIDERGWVRIGDFGASKIGECGSTTTEVIGTATYMAPEMFDAGRPTKKVDIFAFGLILYEVLFGSSVFPKDATMMQIAKIHVLGTRPEIPNSINRHIRKLIERCWSVNPDQRPNFDEILMKLSENFVESWSLIWVR